MDQSSSKLLDGDGANNELLDSKPLIDNTMKSSDDASFVKGLGRARVFYLAWMFVNNVSFGILVVAYFPLFTEVLNIGGYFFPTLVMSFYSMTSLVCSPLAASLSDKIGRRPLFLIAAVSNFFTSTIMGIVPIGWVFGAMVLVQGCADNSLPVGYALLADCVLGGEAKIGPLCEGSNSRHCLRTRSYNHYVSEGIHDPTNSDPRSVFVLDMSAEFTLALVIQSAGVVAGRFCGAMLLSFESPMLVMATSGLIYLPFWAFASRCLPETLPEEARARGSRPQQASTPQQYWEEDEQRSLQRRTSGYPTSAAAVFGVSKPVLRSAAVSVLHGLRQLMIAPRLRTLVGLSFVVSLVQAGTLSVLSLWGTWMFGWSSLKGEVACFLFTTGGLFSATISCRLANSCEPGVVITSMMGSATLGSIACGLSTVEAIRGDGFMALIFVFLSGLGIGCQPLLLALLASEAAPAASRAGAGGVFELNSSQGLVQGINYTFTTIAMGLAPYAYRYICFYVLFEDFSGSDDNDQDDVLGDDRGSANKNPGVFWWWSSFLFAFSAVVAFYLPEH